jgi:hypothetical protein
MPELTPETEQAQAIEAAGMAVLMALADVEKKSGQLAAAQTATALLAVASGFIFYTLGPQAARAALASAWVLLDNEISAMNAGSATLS